MEIHGVVNGYEEISTPYFPVNRLSTHECHSIPIVCNVVYVTYKYKLSFKEKQTSAEHYMCRVAFVFCTNMEQIVV